MRLCFASVDICVRMIKASNKIPLSIFNIVTLHVITSVHVVTLSSITST